MRNHKSFWAAALFGAALFGLSPLAGAGAQAHTRIVAFRSSFDAGTVVISMSRRKLYYVLNDDRAIQYPVAVAKPGKEWLGNATVEQKILHPAWSPPAVVKRDHPRIPSLIRGGSPHNPMGVAAIVLSRYQIAIHGTTRHMRASVGTRASYGCIRMYNEDVSDLYRRVSVGTPVVMER